MILSSVVAVGFLLLASLIGSALVAALGPHARDRDFLTSSAPLLGVAVLLAMLDVVELWVPLRWAAWLIPIVAAVSLGVLVKRRALRWPGALAIVVVLLGVAVGALPTAIVGRPMGALTNDDATYYLAAAEQLVAHPWLEHVNGGEGTACLSEELVHGWLWRTGVANLVGSSIALARVSGPAAISAVTATLMGLVAQASLALGVAAGLRRKPLWRRAIPAAAVVVSAAPAFLGWQHLLGQLAAFAFFPLGMTALARATTHGGVRRFIPAALLLGAAMNTFADSAPVMFLGVIAVLFFGGVRAVGHRLSRAAAVGILAAALFPMTFWRAAWGAYGTVFVRAPAERRGLFPQRGWLERTPIDDVGTLVGVDPWPPWPAPWPLTALAVLQYVAAIAAIILLMAVLWRERRRPGLLAAALSIAVVTIGMIIIISNRYLLGKCLLFEASLIIPAVALAAFVRPNLALKGLFVAWLAGGVAAFAQLARPSGFHVVDDADHDHLAVALERVGPSDVLVLDGFGAPTDTVHDEHRAMRAAHANGIVPIQPGLDGGFFKPRCEDPSLDIFPRVGWALQRAGSEAITTDGDVVERFGRFSLRRVNLMMPGSFVGTWSPTHGWMRAETEADTGTVFRWGEASTAGTLRVVTRTGCGSLTGEARTVDASGSFSIRVGDAANVHELMPAWRRFQTPTFSVHTSVLVELQTFVKVRDAEHAIALRNLSFVPDASCVVAVAHPGEQMRNDLFPEAMGGGRSFVIMPVAGVECGVITATVEAPGDGGVLVVSGARRSFAAAGPVVQASSLVVDFRTRSQFSIEPLAGSVQRAPWRILSLRIHPESCHDGPP